MFTNSFIIKSQIVYFYKPYLLIVLLSWLIIEWMARNSDIEFVFDKFKSKYLRHSVYFFILFMILMFGAFKETAFIYFQF